MTDLEERTLEDWTLEDWYSQRHHGVKADMEY